MRQFISIVAFIMLAWGTGLKAEAIVIEGFYQGKDLYVKNPTGDKGVGFCVYEVQVNGEITSDEINSSAFIIDLHILGLQVGDPVLVEILHREGCSPKVLNEDAVLPQSTFEVVKLEMDPKGILKWETRNEMGELPYFVQQFKWNKWVTVGEVIGLGRMNGNRYSFKVDAHSGENTFRIAQRSGNGKGRYSDEVTYLASDRNPVTIISSKISNKMSFSSQTHFEIFDEYGRLVKRGYDRSVNLTDLGKGQYYINYDNRFGESISKR